MDELLKISQKTCDTIRVAVSDAYIRPIEEMSTDAYWQKVMNMTNAMEKAFEGHYDSPEWEFSSNIMVEALELIQKVYDQRREGK